MIRLIIRFYSIQIYLITAKILDVLGMGYTPTQNQHAFEPTHNKL